MYAIPNPALKVEYQLDLSQFLKDFKGGFHEFGKLVSETSEFLEFGELVLTSKFSRVFFSFEILINF